MTAARLEAEAAADAPVCACCTFGNHTELCICDGSPCCHPAEHGAQRDRLLSRLTAVRAEAEGLAEAMANADRLHTEHVAEERAKLARVRALHVYVEDANYCDICSNHGDIGWPCATLRALDGVVS